LENVSVPATSKKAMQVPSPVSKKRCRKKPPPGPSSAFTSVWTSGMPNRSS
jgi:hypothetical protein